MNDLALSHEEAAELQRLEDIIQRGLETFLEVGAALLEINERKLYKQEFRTFLDYCRERWGISKSRAYQLMSSTALKEIGA